MLLNSEFFAWILLNLKTEEDVKKNIRWQRYETAGTEEDTQECAKYHLFMPHFFEHRIWKGVRIPPVRLFAAAGFAAAELYS